MRFHQSIVHIFEIKEFASKKADLADPTSWKILSKIIYKRKKRNDLSIPPDSGYFVSNKSILYKLFLGAVYIHNCL